MNQKEMFEEFKILGQTINSLSAYVQNDFDRLIDDKQISRDDIAKMVISIDVAYGVFLERLENAVKQTKALLKEKIAEIEGRV